MVRTFFHTFWCKNLSFSLLNLTPLLYFFFFQFVLLLCRLTVTALHEQLTSHLFLIENYLKGEEHSFHGIEHSSHSSDPGREKNKNKSFKLSALFNNIIFKFILTIFLIFYFQFF